MDDLGYILNIFLRFLITIWLPLKAGYVALVEEHIPAIAANYLYIAKTNGLSPKDVRTITTLAYKPSVYVPFTSVFLDAGDDMLKTQWKLRGTCSMRDLNTSPCNENYFLYLLNFYHVTSFTLMLLVNRLGRLTTVLGNIWLNCHANRYNPCGI